MNKIGKIQEIVARCNFSLFGKSFYFRVSLDQKEGNRVFIQVTYQDKCRDSGQWKIWHGRKWYLSEYMTDDEIIKTCYAASKACIEHEIMEGFTVDGIILFNPHVSYEALLSISNKEVRRA